LCAIASNYDLALASAEWSLVASQPAGQPLAQNNSCLAWRVRLSGQVIGKPGITK
jgi:hypothetical protein